MVIERALTYCQGKSIINSINLEDGEERFEIVVPLARRYGAALVVGCSSEIAPSSVRAHPGPGWEASTDLAAATPARPMARVRASSLATAGHFADCSGVRQSCSFMVPIMRAGCDTPSAAHHFGPPTRTPQVPIRGEMACSHPCSHA